MQSDTQYYFHAGYESATGDVRWSSHTRRTRARAEREARSMARGRATARPLVEWWDRKHGLRPGDCELVAGADFV